MIGAGAWSLFTVPALAAPANSNAGGNGHQQDVAVAPSTSTGNGANASGPYDATGVQGPGPGKGGGNAVGRPADGAVGNADNKNPPGQLPGPQDANVGYECEAGPNFGVGKGNPAHSGCGGDSAGAAALAAESTPTVESTPATGTLRAESSPATATPAAEAVPAATQAGTPASQGDGASPNALARTAGVPVASDSVPASTATGLAPAAAQEVSPVPVGPMLGASTLTPPGSVTPLNTVGSITPLTTVGGVTPLAPVGSVTPLSAMTSPAVLGTTPVGPALGPTDPQGSSAPGVSGLLAGFSPGSLGSPGLGIGGGPVPAIGTLSGVSLGAAVPLPDLEPAPAPATTRAALALTGGELGQMVLVSLLFVVLGAALLHRTSTPARTSR